MLDFGSKELPAEFAKAVRCENCEHFIHGKYCFLKAMGSCHAFSLFEDQVNEPIEVND